MSSASGRGGSRAAEAELDVLWEPLTVGGRRIRNRVMVSAHNTTESVERYVPYLAERARGGAGLIVTGGLPVSVSTLQRPRWLRAWLPETAAVYRRLSDAVHEHDGTLFVQIMHCGHQDVGTTSLEDSHALVAPSSVRSPVWNVQPRALAEEDIPEIVSSFGSAAAIVQEGGADGVEVHGGHGYLLQEFLSPWTNRRTDGYGGDAAGRARIVLEVGREVRRRCGEGFPIGLKLGFDEFIGDAGITPATAVQTLREIHAGGSFDYISISGAAYHALHQLVPVMESGQSGHLAAHAHAAKGVVGDLPVMVTGGVDTLRRAAEIVAAGQADVVGMVRAHLADPHLVRKARSGGRDAIRPCVGANQGCWRRAFQGGEVSCTVNPEAGREGQWGDAAFAPADVSRRVVVVGGGPGGMKAAESAARRGHEVVLLERADALGGQLRFAGRLPGRDRWLALVDHLAGSLRRLGVDVRLGTEATADAVADLAPDDVVLATGAGWETTGFSALRPDRDGIPGAGAPHVMGPVTAVADPDACGAHVVIVDDHGTHMALGIAELLAATGRSIDVVTAHSQPGIQTGVLSTIDFPWVYPRLVRAGVRFSVEATVDRIAPGAVALSHVYGGWSRQIDGVDSVVLCMSRQPDDEVFAMLRARGIDARRVGDCLAPREVDDAILEGVGAGIAIGTDEWP